MIPAIAVELEVDDLCVIVGEKRVDRVLPIEPGVDISSTNSPFETATLMSGKSAAPALLPQNAYSPATSIFVLPLSNVPNGDAPADGVIANAYTAATIRRKSIARFTGHAPLRPIFVAGPRLAQSLIPGSPRRRLK